MLVERFLVTLPLLSITFANEVIRGSNLFSNELFRLINTTKQNVVFSPFSVHAALSLAHEGAADRTEEILREALHISSKVRIAKEYQKLLSEFAEETNVTAMITNKIYVPLTTTVKEKFLNSVVNNFHSDVGKANFSNTAEVVRDINEWIRRETNEKIDSLLEAEDLNEYVRVVLLNAIYFKGRWDAKVGFNKSQTEMQLFHVSPTEKIDSLFMYNTGVYSWSESRRLGAKMLRLPYVDNRYSLVVMLPNKADGLDEVEKKLFGVSLSSYLNEFRDEVVEVRIPKFKIEYRVELNQALKQLGLGNIFSNKADFSEMIEGTEVLSISKVVQKATIEVNEEGTEATGATVLLMQNRSLPIRFEADHPFLFFITVNPNGADDGHRNMVLFMGKVYSPHY